MDITGLTDEDLAAEVKRRREVRASRWENERNRLNHQCLVNIDTLLSLTPEHSRSSCSDIDPCNGFMDDKTIPRCVRCYLLRAKEVGNWCKDAKLELSIGHHRFEERT